MRLEKSRSLEMDSDSVFNVQQELARMRRAVRLTQWLILALALLVVVLLVALAAVGGTQGRLIRGLKRREGLLDYPNVTFASNSGYRNVDGLTYGGSLFRGSGFWAAKTILPEVLTDHLAISAGGYAYIIGGESNGNVTANVWRFDPIFHNYTQMSSMPAPVYRFGATLLDNGREDTIYIVGGRNSTIDTAAYMVTSVFIYDIPSNTWSQGTPAPYPQSDTCAGSFYGKVYQIGGYDADYNYLNYTFVYDPATKEWSRTTDMPTARGDHMCANFMGEIYSLGGYYNDGNSTDQNSFCPKMESFNPSTSVWTTRPNLLTPRGDAAISVLPGNLLMLVGGEGHYDNDQNFKYPKHVNEIFYYDDDTWVEKAFIPTARFRTAAATVEGLTYVFGGQDTCIDQTVGCNSFSTNEVFLDLDHPHLYIYLTNEAYNDNAALTTYPF